VLTTLQCLDCRRFRRNQPRGEFRYDASPDGIPDEILESKHNHRFPFPGDCGILYGPITTPQFRA
jgi:hypothetical protein